MDDVLSTRDRQSSPDPHLPTGLPIVHIEINRGRARQRMRPVSVPVFLIGSATDCDLVLGDLRFPEVHTYLFRTARGVLLRHLGAGPEVTVEGRLVRSARLHDGDRLRTGPYEFRVHIDHSPMADAYDGADARDAAGLPAGNVAIDNDVTTWDQTAVSRLLADVEVALREGLARLHVPSARHGAPDQSAPRVTSQIARTA